MAHYLRAMSAIGMLLLLSACVATAPSDKPRATGSAAMTQNPRCLTETGSRLGDNRTDCSAFGRSYSHEDIDRTGATTVGDALRLLDPSITVQH
jgi:hypothetical protein